MVITDKMKKDIQDYLEYKIKNNQKFTTDLKDFFENRNYEVEEEEESKLDELYEEIEHMEEMDFIKTGGVQNLSALIRETIKELQQKPKIDADLIEWLEYLKNGNYYPEHFNYTGFNDLAEKLLKQLKED
jgi:cysteinyl-tRNA synthetase